MGEVIRLAERREARRRRRLPAIARAEFLFDLACPFTYLAAERVERGFDAVSWTPASATVLRRGVSTPDADALRLAAEARATALRLPLVWPERFPAGVPAAMRVAHYAVEHGRGAAFVLAAGRLAFGGGFDLDDPETLVEASAPAGLAPQVCLRAAADPPRDEPIRAAAERLRAAGVRRLPALRVGRSLFAGEEQIAGAAAAARMRAVAAGS